VLDIREKSYTVIGIATVFYALILSVQGAGQNDEVKAGPVGPLGIWLH